MAEDKLSEIEIKLINATLKFIKKSNLSCSINLSQWQNSGIKIESCLGERIVGIYYSSNSNIKEMNVYGNTEGKVDKYKEEYKSFLISEIPEIKDRIK